MSEWITRIAAGIGVVTGVIGAVAGGWGAYTAHQTLELRQPLDEHVAVAESFTAQIASVEARGDQEELGRLRLEYEAYEEEWRLGRRILKKVEQAITLPPARVSEEIKHETKNWLGSSIHHGWGIDPSTYANAWFVAGDYKKAAESYEVALIDDPGNPFLRLGAARAYGYLHSQETRPDLAFMWLSAAKENAATAVNIFDAKAEPLPVYWTSDENLKVYWASSDSDVDTE